MLYDLDKWPPDERKDDMNEKIGLTYELYRGMHSRIANRLGLSRSYVWRVANGERSSPAVEAALEKELARIRMQASKLSHPAGNGRRPNSR